MKQSTKKRPKRLCYDCIHLSACSAQTVANMMNTDATNCYNYETVYDFLDRFKPLWKGLSEMEKVKPVVKGNYEQDGHHIRCTVCGGYWCQTDREGDEYPQNFCPNCGADMTPQNEIKLRKPEPEEEKHDIEIVYCRDCDYWDRETELLNTLPRQCECKMFSNSSVSHYTKENGYCYMGEKRKTITTSSWLRGLSDEELVYYLDWFSFCPKHCEECDGINDTCAKCILQELKKERWEK